MWDSEMVVVLRHMIDDLADTPKYSDDRLSQLILVGAQFVKAENPFETDYTINIENGVLKPDPTASSTRDDSFINLTLLRSACLLASSGLGKSASLGILVVEGPNRFDNRGANAGKQLQVKTWCEAYADAKWEFVSASLTTPGEAIIGPYRSMDYKNGSGGSFLFSDRDRMN
jgi:hypothetical protein